MKPVTALLFGIIIGGIIIGSSVYAVSRGSGIQAAQTYKKFVSEQTFGAVINFELPQTWSTYRSDTMGIDKLEAPTYSVGQFDVAFGDTNWEQVDFYLVQNDIVDRLIAEAKQNAKANGLPDSVWSNETVAGVNATVYTDPLDNGEVSKGGTGGKTYYIKRPTQDEYSAKTLVIVQQSAASAEFVREFDRLIKTLEFVNN